jgi:DegV family protein with EDD domain
MLVAFAAECAAAGVSAERTIAAVKDLVSKTVTYGVLHDTKYAVRGGRLPAWVRTAARILNVMPYIRTTTDGRIAPAGFAFGRRNMVRKFARHVARRARPIGAITVAIGHAACPDDARELECLLRRELPEIKRLTKTELGAGLGVHTGPGTLIVSIQPFTTAADVSG